MKLNLNSIIINAQAGHGKDYTYEALKKIFNNELIKISFAEKLKSIIIDNLPEKISLNFNEKGIELLNKLKDEEHEVKVFGDLNMRSFLQTFMGNEIIRSINPKINMLFTAKYMIEELKKNNESVFVCTDNRYANEQEFLLKFNQVAKSERIDFLEDYISINQTNKEDLEIINLIEEKLKKYSKNKEDSKYLSKLVKDFMKEHSKIKSTIKNKSSYSDILKDFNYENISKLNKEEGLKMGIINVFRPILPINKKETENLKKDIMEYNNFSKKEVESIIDRYKEYGIEFNLENVKKYSILRANPNHLSEKELQKRKPLPFINNREDGSEISITKQIKESMKNKIIEKFSKNKIKKTRN